MSTKKHLLAGTLMAAMFGALALIPFIPNLVVSSAGLPIKTSELEVDEDRVLMLFAGFPGCAQLCPTTLRNLSEIYTKVDNNKLGVVFTVKIILK